MFKKAKIEEALIDLNYWIGSQNSNSDNYRWGNNFKKKLIELQNTKDKHEYKKLVAFLKFNIVDCGPLDTKFSKIVSTL